MTYEAGRRVAVITGASAGIGKATARMLAQSGWSVIGTGRDPQRMAAAEQEVRAASAPGTEVNFIRGDFDSMRDVCRVAQEIAQITREIHVLVNNAGGVRDRLIVTGEGLEATFASNHLAPFLLTRQLIPLLRSTAAKAPPGHVRVLAVSSRGHEYSSPFHWDEWQDLTSFTPGLAYCRAKMANILFTRELARREEHTGIVAQVMHPGDVASNFHSHANEEMRAHSREQVLVDPDVPAETLVWLATSPEAGLEGGRYFYRCEEVEPSSHALDDGAARLLWENSEKILAHLDIRAAA